MMFSLTDSASTIQRGLLADRGLFSRQSALEYVERYLQGLLLSANKTLQGIVNLVSGLIAYARHPDKPSLGIPDYDVELR